jgi:hypothetical protein
MRQAPGKIHNFSSVSGRRKALKAVCREGIECDGGNNHHQTHRRN